MFSDNSTRIIRALDEDQKNLVVQQQISPMKLSEPYPKDSKMESITALRKVRKLRKLIVPLLFQ